MNLSKTIVLKSIQGGLGYGAYSPLIYTLPRCSRSTAHYEYMALAKKTPVLREARLLCIEPVHSNKTRAPQSMQTLFEAMFQNNCCSGYMFNSWLTV